MKTALRILVLGGILLSQVTSNACGAEEAKVLKNLKLAQKIYLVRAVDGKFFKLLGIEDDADLEEVKAFAATLKPILDLGTDALCLEGEFGADGLIIVYPVIKGSIYFVDPSDDKRPLTKPIQDFFKDSKIEYDLNSLIKFLGR